MTIFEKLEECDIWVPEKDRIFPWFIVYDFEAILEKVERKGEKLVYTTRHKPVSVAMATNAPHCDPVCYVETDIDELLRQMFDYLDETADEIRELSEGKWGWVKTALNKKMDQWQKEPMETSEDQSYGDGDTMMKNALSSLYGELEGYISQVPVLGFNSAKYDLNLVKQKLAMYMQMHMEEEQRPFAVKKIQRLRLPVQCILQIPGHVPIPRPWYLVCQIFESLWSRRAKGIFSLRMVGQCRQVGLPGATTPRSVL